MKRKLLVVDDDRSVSTSLKKLFEGEGFEVFMAWDAAHAMAHCKANSIDLVVLDINLGTDDGWSVFQAMVDINPLVPTVVITAEYGQRDRAIAAGVEALIEKPIDVPSLLELVDRLLAEDSEGRLRRVCGEESYCRYVAKDYATFLKLLEERRSAPLHLPSESRTARPKSESSDTRGTPANAFAVIGDPTASTI